MLVAPSTTWLFVRTAPVEFRIIPVPAACAPWYFRTVFTATTPTCWAAVAVVPPLPDEPPPSGLPLPPNGLPLPPNGSSLPPNGSSLPPNGLLPLPPNGSLDPEPSDPEPDAPEPDPLDPWLDVPGSV